MIEIEARLDELSELGLHRRPRMVSGPQGAHVLLDGKPVLLLCSDNYLGFSDHPRVREAAADAAKRWGAGTGSSRLVSGSMTIHRRLEERLAAFASRDSALLFGSAYLANAGVIAALARPGDVVFSDELNHPSIADGCRLSGAEIFVYDHCDLDHLAWGLDRANGQGALIATESVFAMDGDLAPLGGIVELAEAYGVRVLVDEGHALGALGPGGRGVLAAQNLEDAVDVIVATLGKALGSYGAFVACDAVMARYLLTAARTLAFSTAPSPPAVAGALAALDLLEERPRRVAKLRDNARALRDALALEGFPDDDWDTHIVALVVGDSEVAVRICDDALTRGVFVQPICSPVVAPEDARLRLTVMASHHEDELRAAARALAQSARAAGLPLEDSGVASSSARAGHARVSDDEVRPAARAAEWSTPRQSPAAPRDGRVFDVEAPEPVVAQRSRRADEVAAREGERVKIHRVQPERDRDPREDDDVRTQAA